ncbi:MAG: beta-ketoacyl-[acyl-carrier-protein] synthase family protein [Gammaproteobacteria bacterium]
MEPLRLSAYTAVNAFGRGLDASLRGLQAQRTGLRRCDFDGAELDTWIGRVEGLEQEPINGALGKFDCRNNRLAEAALAVDGFAHAVSRAVRRYGAHRIGVFVGTSTSGIMQTELAYRNMNPQTRRLPDDFQYRHTQNSFSCADYVRQRLGLLGLAQCVSTACSSSAKVFAVAHRHIQSEFCDAAVVGGADSLCLSTIYGFNSLELISPRPCRPWDKQRDGISIGEAAGFALLERAPGDGVALLGYGESSDAHHMSSPHPEGAGAVRSMRLALASAGLEPADIDYINLHGTATPANDAAEDLAVQSVFATQVPCSSTKGGVGHTLGAAGITEAVHAALAMAHDFIPASQNTESVDPRLNAKVQLSNTHARLRHVMSNSFGFGGNNCSLIIGRTAS